MWSSPKGLRPSSAYLPVGLSRDFLPAGHALGPAVVARQNLSVCDQLRHGSFREASDRRSISRELEDARTRGGRDALSRSRSVLFVHERSDKEHDQPYGGSEAKKGNKSPEDRSIQYCDIHGVYKGKGVLLDAIVDPLYALFGANHQALLGQADDAKVDGLAAGMVEEEDV